jgi:uncharacterized protein YkwD
MNKKFIFTFIILAGLILSACNGSPPAVDVSTPTSTSTDTGVTSVSEATATQPQVTEETPAPSTFTVESTTTPEPPRPTNEPNCTNSASFVADVTIPDNTTMAGGTTFTKTWQILNTGTCIWASDYSLGYYSDESMGAPDSVPLSITYPGQTLNTSILLTAPNSLGTHRGNFVVRNPEGLIMQINSDSRLWVIINVDNLRTAAPAATGSAVAGTPTTPLPTSADGVANCAHTTETARINAAIDAVNAYRAQAGLPPYGVNSQLMKAAQSHANDMACNQLFGHTGSDGSTVASRVAASGYKAASSSENVYGSNPPLSGQEAVNWWITDKTDTRHRLNLVSDTYIQIGVGYAFFDNYGYYVIVFGTP